MEKAFRPHDEKNVYLARVVPVEDAAGWLHDLAIAPPAQFRGLRAALWMLGKLLDVTEDALYECGSCSRAV
jgi:hypothetical protein